MTKAELRNFIGNRIREERCVRNMSIDDLAELIDKTPGYVGLIERGQRGTTIFTLLRIANIFKVSMDDFFYSNGNLAINIAEPSRTLRSKLESLSFDLTEKELEFVVGTVRNLKKLRSGDFISDDDDDDTKFY